MSANVVAGKANDERTCFEALASSEFCSNSLNKPMENGYVPRMAAIVSVGRAYSPKPWLDDIVGGERAPRPQDIYP